MALPPIASDAAQPADFLPQLLYVTKETLHSSTPPAGMDIVPALSQPQRGAPGTPRSPSPPQLSPPTAAQSASRSPMIRNSCSRPCRHHHHRRAQRMLSSAEFLVPFCVPFSTNRCAKCRVFWLLGLHEALRSRPALTIGLSLLPAERARDPHS